MPPLNFNIENILSGVNDAYEKLYSAEENIYDLLSGAIKSLSGVSEYDASLSELAERLNSSLIDIEDIASELKSKSGKADFDEGEFNELNLRIDIINSLCRKYGENEEEILLYRDRIEEVIPWTRRLQDVCLGHHLPLFPRPWPPDPAGALENAWWTMGNSLPARGR